jgi:hypothetical protein
MMMMTIIIIIIIIIIISVISVARKLCKEENRESMDWKFCCWSWKCSNSWELNQVLLVIARSSTG